MSKPSLLSRWVQAVRRENFYPNKRTVLCSKHFQSVDFIPNQTVKRLREDVVPSVFTFRVTPKRRPAPKDRSELQHLPEKIKLKCASETTLVSSERRDDVSRSTSVPKEFVSK